MKKIAVILSCAVFLGGVSLQGQSGKAAAVGVWRSFDNGLPTVTLTLAEDSGEIGGAVVFYAIDRESRRVLFVEPHTLLQAKLEGHMLSFQMRMGGDRPGLARVDVAFGTENKATLHCLDCGADSPTVELIRQTE
jgi:hypothetical protein